jgi:hypothetical protein
MTIQSIITGALRQLNVIGASEPPQAQDTAICLEALNALMDSLSNSLSNIFTITPLRFLLTANKEAYTLGPGGDWDTPRPMRIETANVMLYPAIGGDGSIGQTSSTQFFGLKLANYSQFAQQPLRFVGSTWPTMLYDDCAYPLRTVRLWPVPQNAFAIELWMWAPLSTYTDLTADLNLPKGYERYLTLKLAVEVAPEFGKQVSDTTRANLEQAETAIKTLNKQTQVVTPSDAGLSLTGRAQRRPALYPRGY